jgi:cell division inhibitor SepF
VLIRCRQLPLLEFEAVWFALTEVGVVQRNARAWLGPVEHDDDALAGEDAGEFQDEEENPSGPLAAADGLQIVIVRPRNFRDAITIGEYFRLQVPVIINLEDMHNAEAWRIIDFVSGLILGLGGDIERVSRRTFLIVPACATIVNTHKSLTEEAFFNRG